MLPRWVNVIANEDYVVDSIISSPAVRAITTAKLIASELNYNTQKIDQNMQIYEASVDMLVDLVTTLDDNLFRVMLVGHNPGFTVLCNYLSDADIDNMPTCSVAQIQFDVGLWGSVSAHSGVLLDFDYPKKILITIMLNKIKNATINKTKIY